MYVCVCVYVCVCMRVIKQEGTLQSTKCLKHTQHSICIKKPENQGMFSPISPSPAQSFPTLVELNIGSLFLI